MIIVTFGKPISKIWTFKTLDDLVEVFTPLYFKSISDTSIIYHEP